MVDIVTARPMASGIRTLKPTNDMENYIHEGLAYSVVRSPFFAHLFYNETQLRYADKFGSIAATDAKSIFVDAERMIALQLDMFNVAFVLCHEVGHVVRNDLLMAQIFQAQGFVMWQGRKLAYIPSLMNQAEDYCINAMLVDSKIGKMPCYPGGAQMGLYDRSISEKGMESSIDIYGILYMRLPAPLRNALEKGDLDQLPKLPDWAKKEGFDIHLEPTPQAVKEAGSGRLQQAIAAAGEAARSSGQGVIPAAVQQIIGDILEPKVSWQDKLKSSMTRAAGDPFYDWRYLDKRMLARPEPQAFARIGHMGAGLVVFISDSSGSVFEPRIQQQFFSEGAAIVAELNPAQMVCMWCDAEVKSVIEVDEPDDLDDVWKQVNDEGGVKGGGGTDFRPPFAKIKEMGLEPDMVVYVTDTYGTFPKMEPDYPVIWVSIVDDESRVPWGDFIYLDIDA